jgi:outer membrane receptor protein involved in Fe transport
MPNHQSRPPIGGCPIFAIAIAAAVVTPAFAEENPPTEQVLITARPPDPLGNDAFSATVLDAQQIEIAPQLDEALRQVPGLSLFRRNSSFSANPTVQGVSLRSIGASGAGRALVTLDGVPQNDPFGGWVIWDSLPPEDIESAEIVRGSGAGPYGAGALTGVIALTERTGSSGIADAESGEFGEARAAAAGNRQSGNVSIGGSAMYITSGGWIPVSDAQRGAADTPLGLQASSASIHGGVEILPGTQVTARFGYYKERRNVGIGAGLSTTDGTTGSITIAHPVQASALGWRLQGWFRKTGMSNLTYSVGANRASASPASNQYGVPALGWGGNAALRGSIDWLDWEVGGDVRLNQGQSQEQYHYSGAEFLNGKLAGGRALVGGIYAEGAARFDDWLLTAGVRLDKWRNYDGHEIQTTLATAAITLDNHTPEASGSIPTARAGIRRNLMNGLYLRSAAYEGFRAPSLNELFRAFRVGNNYTLANSALKPERLYGAEIGGGDDQGPFIWDLTVFWNKLSDAITNFTVANGPGTFPEAGFIPAGGQLLQRRNIGDINAYGVEGDAQWAVSGMLSLRGAFNLTDAHVEGGTLAPELTGKRPAQTPRWTVTAGLVASPISLITVEGFVRYESLRWSDDQNTLPLTGVATVDARINFHVLPGFDVYAAVDNMFNAELQSARTADQVVTIDAPRLFHGGIDYRF